MPKSTRKTNVATKPGLVYGWRELDPLANSHWNAITNQLQDISQSYGFLRIQTPVLEEEKTYVDLFKDQPSELERTIFTGLSSKSLALRKHVLPSLLRYYVQNKVGEIQSVSKWYYLGSVAATDERQAVQLGFEFGFEAMGNINHLAEAQVIAVVWDYLDRLGIPNLTLEVNTIGDAGVQNSYQNILKEYLKSHDYDLCDNCVSHLGGRVLNVFRCGLLPCQLVVAEAPSVLDYLDDTAKSHFTNVLEALDELGIPYQLNQYYAGPHGSSRTNFVIKYIDGEKSLVIGEGSGHESWMKNVTGKPKGAFGFIGDLSKLSEAMHKAELEPSAQKISEVFLVPLGELAAKKSLRLFRDLISNQISVHDHFGTEGVKNQLKLAQEHNAPIALIIGQKEAMDEMVILRDVKSGMQEVFSYDKIIEEVRKRLGR